MLYTRLATSVAMCIGTPRRYTRLASLASPNPNPTKLATAYMASRVYRHFVIKSKGYHQRVWWNVVHCYRTSLIQYTAGLQSTSVMVTAWLHYRYTGRAAGLWRMRGHGHDSFSYCSDRLCNLSMITAIQPSLCIKCCFARILRFWL